MLEFQKSSHLAGTVSRILFALYSKQARMQQIWLPSLAVPIGKDMSVQLGLKY
jgi:hypothetical protein